MLDAVADSLEKKGFIKETYELDKIADVVEAGDYRDQIAFIPQNVLKFSLNTANLEKTKSMLKEETGATEVEYHRPNTHNCTCPDKQDVGHFDHVVLKNPTVGYKKIVEDWANKSAKMPAWFVGKYIYRLPEVDTAPKAPGSVIWPKKVPYNQLPDYAKPEGEDYVF